MKTAKKWIIKKLRGMPTYRLGSIAISGIDNFNTELWNRGIVCSRFKKHFVLYHLKFNNNENS